MRVTEVWPRTTVPVEVRVSAADVRVIEVVRCDRGCRCREHGVERSACRSAVGHAVNEGLHAFVQHLIVSTIDDEVIFVVVGVRLPCK